MITVLRPVYTEVGECGDPGRILPGALVLHLAGHLVARMHRVPRGALASERHLPSTVDTGGSRGVTVWLLQIRLREVRVVARARIGRLCEGRRDGCDVRAGQGGSRLA